MKEKPICYEPGRVIPQLYSGVPTFVGVPRIDTEKEIEKYDAIVFGMPWEGTCTTGTWTGAELGPKAIRSASVRYGGFLPDQGYDCFDYLCVGDYGDAGIFPGDPRRTFESIEEKARAIYEREKISIGFGGDHSVLGPVLRALGGTGKKVGLIHFDSHMDNLDTYGPDDKYARCSPLYRAYETPGVGGERTVHIGIRGPRNHPDSIRIAREHGATVISSFDVKKRGIEDTFNRAMKIAGNETDGIYVTVCSDVLDVAFNPGGPPDFAGLDPYELFSLLYMFASSGLLGFDFVEIYPPQDPNNVSGHMASWAALYVLSGLAKTRMNG